MQTQKVMIKNKQEEWTLDKILKSKLNVIVNKSNGYSHSWMEIENYSFDKHSQKRKCPFTKNESLDILFLTDKPTGKIKNSSQISFS
jgi:hypothetical protein